MASDRRSPFFPDAPTYADLGIKNASLDIWYGVWALNKVAPEIIEHLSREMTNGLATPALKERSNGLAAEPLPVDTAAFRKLLAEEGATLSKLIKERRIVAD